MNPWFMLSALLAILAQLAWPQATPNFTGRWILDLEKCTFSEGTPRPSGVEIIVTQTKSSIQSDWRITSPSRSVHVALQFTTDGTESHNRSGGNEIAFGSLTVPRDASAEGADIFTSGKQNDRELKVNYHWTDIARAKRQVELDETWKLSSDGKVLNIDRTSGRDHYGAGVATKEVHTLLVFKRAATPQKK